MPKQITEQEIARLVELHFASSPVWCVSPIAKGVRIQVKKEQEHLPHRACGVDSALCDVIESTVTERIDTDHQSTYLDDNGKRVMFMKTEVNPPTLSFYFKPTPGDSEDSFFPKCRWVFHAFTDSGELNAMLHQYFPQV